MVRDLFRLRRRDRPASGDDGAILTLNQRDLVTQELAALERLSAILEAYPASDEDKERSRTPRSN